MKEFENVLKEFQKVKKEMKDVDTSDKTSGIYIMYIDGLNLNNLIPLYVGQSVNLYNRKNAHKGNIKKLFVLSKEEYNIQIPFNAGKYLYCKIVSNLRNNYKNLEDIKFKILEYCDKENLDEREQYWIKFFEATLYGFNQFDEILQSNKLIAELRFKKENVNYNKIVKEGVKLLKKFEEKINRFNDTCINYKYYSVNYTLLIGNYNLLYKMLYDVSIKHYMEIVDETSEVLNIALEQADINKKNTILKFMNKDILKIGKKLFKEFEIK